jgi:hypothetical protein
MRIDTTIHCSQIQYAHNGTLLVGGEWYHTTANIITCRGMPNKQQYILCWEGGQMKNGGYIILLLGDIGIQLNNHLAVIV